MAGFFNPKGEGPACAACRLNEKCESPKLEVSGEGRSKALFIGEINGKTEDEQGVRDVGETSHLLNQRLKKFGFFLKRDFWKINAVNCWSPKPPTKKQIEYCQPMVTKAIKELNPRFVILAGNAALTSYFTQDEVKKFIGPDLVKNLTVERFRRLRIPDRVNNCWILPMYHPSFALKREKDNFTQFVWNRDLKFLLSCIKKDKPLPDYDPRQHVEMITNLDDLRTIMRKLMDMRCLTGYDFEATGLKPQKPGHLITTMAISTDDISYAFPLQYQNYWGDATDEVEELVCDYIGDPEMPKVAHHAKFEDLWGRVILGVEQAGCVGCTQDNQHILDDRPKFCGLKFQAFIRWGIPDYAADSKKYIRDDGSGFNRMNVMPLRKQLLYVGADAHATVKLHREQCKEFRLGMKGEKPTVKCAQLFREGAIALADTQEEGICTDEEYLVREDARLGEEVQKIEEELMASKEAVRFKRAVKRPLSLTSNTDLQKLFYEILGYEKTKETASGKGATDFDTLMTIKGDFAENLVRMRKLSKIKDTYLAQFMREVVNGRMHPFFNLHTTRTGRSSSNMPNFQNIPVRDKEAKKSCRRAIIAPEGFKLFEIDYGSLEVRIIACYTQDPTLVAYINDPSTDMHRDQAKELFLLRDNEVAKMVRFHSKNGFVFPEFYGSWYKNCARNLWNEVVLGDLKVCNPGDKPTDPTGMTIRRHLRREGIVDYEDFEEHVKGVEQHFWKRFAHVKDWQEEQYENFLFYGYTNSMFGFQRSGYLSKNDVINTPIQGAAFHCLLWSFIELNKVRKQEQWRTVLQGQIHDSIFGAVHPDEERHVLKTANRIMTKELREAEPWIIVPLEVEPELTPINGSWNQKEAVAVPE